VALEDFRSFVVADIPGLIEGAHEGHGLGDKFLKHIERTKVLVHLIDVSQPRDPVQDFKTLLRELELFNSDLARRRQVVLASKIDALHDPRSLTRLKIMCARRKIPFHAISSVTGRGIPELVHLLARMLGLQPPS